MVNIKIANYLLLLLGSIILSGCASSTFLYDRADWLARVYLERYVDLDREQSHRLKTNLQSLKEWHREGELSLYLQFLDDLEADLQEKVTTEHISDWSLKVRAAFTSVRDAALPHLIEVAETLSDDQVDEFMQNLEKQNRKYDKKYLSRDEEEYKESIGEEMEKRLSYWLGSLTREQKAMITEMSGEFERQDFQWMAERREFHRALGNVLRKEKGWQSRLGDLVNSSSDYGNEDYAALEKRNVQRVFATLAGVLNSRTERQQVKLSKRLGKWKNDISRMQGVPYQPEAT